MTPTKDNDHNDELMEKTKLFIIEVFQLFHNIFRMNIDVSFFRIKFENFTKVFVQRVLDEMLIPNSNIKLK